MLILRDFEGLAASEVASVLELSVSAVKSRLHRARIELRDRMQRALGAQVPRDPACPDVAQLFSRKLEDELDAGTCAEMESHLDGCPRCAADCAELKRTLALCSQSADEPVPEALQDRVRRAVSELLRRAR